MGKGPESTPISPTPIATPVVDLSKGPEKGNVLSFKRKINFIKQRMAISYDELAEILPSEENGYINTDYLNTNYWFIDYLARELKPDYVKAEVRRPLVKWDGKNIIDLMQEGKAEEVHHHYLSIFESFT
jgi:hypothetical protein